MCISPIKIKNPQLGKAFCVNRTQYIEVPCGKCVECLKFKQQQRLSSLLMESKTSVNTFFLTLTYNDDYVSPTGVQKSHIREFGNRLRKHGIKYTISSEYGTETNRPHYHALLFTDLNLKQICQIIDENWIFGNYQCTTATPARIRYMANSHITKQSHVPIAIGHFVDEETGEVIENVQCNANFTISSPKIGFDYADKNSKYLISHDFKVQIDGHTFKVADNIQKFVLNKHYKNETRANMHKYFKKYYSDMDKPDFRTSWIKKLGLPFSISEPQLLKRIQQYAINETKKFKDRYINKRNINTNKL